MRQDMADVNLSTIEVNGSDKANFVTANIENHH
jgi:hypothetical protein